MKKIEVCVFIDALGWEIVKRNNFMNEVLLHRKSIKMQFGYSSAALPTILSGKSPSEHNHFSFFYYEPKNSPFKNFRFLKYFFGAGLHPKSLLNRGRVRRIISKIVAKLKGYSGYFSLYSVPFEKLQFFDYCEKTDIFASGGLSPNKNLKDILDESGLKFHISNWRNSEGENFEAAKEAIRGGVDFLFLYTGAFDAFMHDNVFRNDAVARRLKIYEENLMQLIDVLKNSGRNFDLTVISDHGMSPTIATVNLMKLVENLSLKFGKDYVAFFDSTMARFWYPTNSSDAKNKIFNALKNERGKFITKAEKQKYGIDFADDKFGEDIFLMDDGIQISPCDLGAKAMNGMHGFSPEAANSYAVYLSTKKPSTNLNEVKDFFNLMKTDIESLKK